MVAKVGAVKMNVVIEVRLIGCRRERKGQRIHAAKTAGSDHMTLICFVKEKLGGVLLLITLRILRPKLGIYLMPMMEFSEELMLQVITIQFGRVRAKPTRPPRLALSHVVTSI